MVPINFLIEVHPKIYMNNHEWDAKLIAMAGTSRCIVATTIVEKCYHEHEAIAEAMYYFFESKDSLFKQKDETSV